MYYYKMTLTMAGLCGDRLCTYVACPLRRDTDQRAPTTRVVCYTGMLRSNACWHLRVFASVRLLALISVDKRTCETHEVTTSSSSC